MSASRTSPTSARNANAARSVARGNPAPAFEQAAVRIKAEYRMPVEHHNPMEPFAATAVWEGDGRITVYDKTQGPQNSRNYVADVCGMPRDKVRLLYRCPNAELRQRLVKLDQNTPCDMRAPGGAEGMYAIECAMDELAYAAK